MSDLEAARSALAEAEQMALVRSREAMVPLYLHIMRCHAAVQAAEMAAQPRRVCPCDRCSV